MFLAVILRWERFPLLAFLLPVVQVAWVNSQGLFVLGLVILGFGLDRRGASVRYLCSGAATVVEADSGRERGHGAGLPDQSVWDSRGALSD